MNPNDIHRITRGQMEHVYKCLKYIDQAREALAAKGPGNEAIVSELKKSADGIYHVVKDLPRVEAAD
jgi:hypothetical protein